ncbi:MAG: hypothetical protein H6713_33265 [Myxococcales bacterium]|nr:hypothetical protein [Myxococcales bacterium]MCB9754832.1 hypothetical protein [Myxococcales bacterium]
MTAKTDSRERIFTELIESAEFSDADRAVLSDVVARIEPQLPATLDSLEQFLRTTPRLLAAFGAGDDVDERAGLVAWVTRFLEGRFDLEYFESRALRYRRFVQSDVDQRVVITTMSRIRLALHSALHWTLQGAGWTSEPSDERARLHFPLDKICDIELGIIIDVSRERYEGQIKTAERLATIGQVAASIGHDLRNPLAVIQTSVHMLSRRIRDDARSARHLSRIGDQITLCTVIISDLLELARNRAPERVPTFMPDLVREAGKSVPRARGVTVALDIDEGLPPAQVDPGQVRQLIVNLVLNAVQAVGAEGHVWVRLRGDDDVVRVVIEDDGPGLTEETRKRLFEPMFTTRVRGTGLGLVLCRKVVEAHGGVIAAENRPEGGARFQVTLPRDPPETPDAGQEAAAL